MDKIRMPSEILLLKSPLCLAFLTIALVFGSRAAEAQETGAETRLYRYACLNDAGRNTGTIEMRVTSRKDGMDIVSTDATGQREFARLGPGMVQEEVLIESVTGNLKRFSLAPGEALLGDRSLFFVLPSLVDMNNTGNEARFMLVRPEGGQRAGMKLRVEGIVDVSDFYGNKERAYRISMKLADPLGRLFWPYTYNYYYRVKDLCFFAYDGPDEYRANSRIVLMESRENGY
jgi:hypothetical protein